MLILAGSGLLAIILVIIAITYVEYRLKIKFKKLGYSVRENQLKRYVWHDKHDNTLVIILFVMMCLILISGVIISDS